VKLERARIELGLEAIEPSIRGLLRHVEHALEAFASPVVRVGDVLAIPLRARLEESRSFAFEPGAASISGCAGWPSMANVVEVIEVLRHPGGAATKS
jgi:hypothetical protein